MCNIAKYLKTPKSLIKLSRLSTFATFPMQKSSKSSLRCLNAALCNDVIFSQCKFDISWSVSADPVKKSIANNLVVFSKTQVSGFKSEARAPFIVKAIQYHATKGNEKL